MRYYHYRSGNNVFGVLFLMIGVWFAYHVIRGIVQAFR